MVNYAAFDFGSNSTRILIASASNGKINKIIKKDIVTKMAEGTSSSKSISIEATRRVCEAVEIFFETIMAYEVEDIFAIGTSAMRDSVNALEVKRTIEKDFDTLWSKVNLLPNQLTEKSLKGLMRNFQKKF